MVDNSENGEQIDTQIHTQIDTHMWVLQMWIPTLIFRNTEQEVTTSVILIDTVMDVRTDPFDLFLLIILNQKTPFHIQRSMQKNVYLSLNWKSIHSKLKDARSFLARKKKRQVLFN